MQRTPGFGLLDVIITLAIIGVIASVATSFFTRDTSQQDLKSIEFSLNNMITTACQEARSKQTSLRLVLSAKHHPHSLHLEQSGIEPKNPASLTFTRASIIGGLTAYTLPSTWTIEAVYNGSIEQLSANKHIATMMIGPVGVLPPLLIHLKNTRSTQVATLKAEPFLRTFTLHNSKVLPPKATKGAR